ncbi:hypothetical protein Ahy_B06g083587 [Arachis hypogaea]|uniref:PB1-like domain-containing protein n=1 Tax=Arachis hypogaea TaxID=3818 RepID=A0A444YQ00_ARAHY|nr:hypothetical protein Ahy_B06g083587 [Arachis hypogaea]
MLTWWPVFADKRGRDIALEAWREEEGYKARGIVESRVTVLKWHRGITIVRKEQPYEEMDRLVTFVYHHMGCLKKVRDGNVIYEGGLVTEIHRVNVETCNLFFVEGLFLDLGYPGYNEAYWLEPSFELGQGLRVLRTDAEVMRMCESAIKNDNNVHLYFDHPIDANPEIIDDDVVSSGSSESMVEVNPPGDERETEVVSEETGEVNQMNKALTVVVKETLNEVVIEKGVDVNESEAREAPEKVVKRVRKRHPRPPPSSLSQERRAAESEQPEGDPLEAEIVNEQTHERNDDDAHVSNEGANNEEPLVDEMRAEEASTQNAGGVNLEEPVVDELRAEETATENAADTETQRKDRINSRRNHPRPQPSGQRIVPGKDDEAPRVEVPNPNRADREMGPEMYQYESDELYSPPGSDDEDEPVFPQHNPNTPFGKITLELNMEFETMEHFKAAVQKYNIQIGRQVFYLRNEKKSIPSQEYWEHHEGLPCLSPPYKRPIGRPSKKRKKDSSEQDSGSQYNAKRRYGQITCQTCKRVGHNSRTCPERSDGAAAQEEAIDEDEAREQEANWEETMEAAHAAHVADEENLTQNHPQSQPDENTEADLSTTTTAAPPNATTTPATSSGPAPPVAARPVEPTPPIPPTRGRGRTIRRGRTPTSTAPQTRVASHAAGSNCQILAIPTNAARPSTGLGSMSQGPLGRPTLQAQNSASSRPPTMTRETMAAASPATQSRFTGFMPTPSLKKKKPSASIKK